MCLSINSSFGFAFINIFSCTLESFGPVRNRSLSPRCRYPGDNCTDFCASNAGMLPCRSIVMDSTRSALLMPGELVRADVDRHHRTRFMLRKARLAHRKTCTLGLNECGANIRCLASPPRRFVAPAHHLQETLAAPAPSNLTGDGGVGIRGKPGKEES